MRWLVADSLYCRESYFCSHVHSYGHYLAEAGEAVARREWCDGFQEDSFGWPHAPDVVFALDRYDVCAAIDAPRHVAQVAAICPVMPWDVRKSDGTPAYDLVLSSIPWMVEEARSKGCRAEYMPLAFDTRARVCGMGVKRDLGAIFIGSIGPNHQKRARILEELRDVVTVLPPVFGREYFRTLARAKVVVNIHAEWARGIKNNMRLFEAAGMGCDVLSDGQDPAGHALPGSNVRDWRDWIHNVIGMPDFDIGIDTAAVLVEHTYESRIPRLIELVKSL